MDAAELSNGGASFVIDTSTWWRIEVLPAELPRPLRSATMEDRMLITPVVRMRSSDVTAPQPDVEERVARLPGN
jgi:hypothetical protein